MKVHKPKTINEAINDLQQFLECDLYSKFRPTVEIKGKEWKRTDFLKNEKEFYKYLDCHFNILKKQIKSITSKK